ncbi:Smr/MutS family protein [Thermodesulfobacteriota bacterium]
MKKKKGQFNPVFKDLKSKIKTSSNESKKISHTKPDVPKNDLPPDEEAFFEDAMAGVMPLQGKDKKAPKPATNTSPPHASNESELEAISHLKGLVKGSIEMDINFSDEYIEGSISGVSRKIMRRLKRGQIPVQDYLDLHGLHKQDAQMAVRDFLVNSHKFGKRCILIVHGRGLNSPDSLPVLKERLPTWLNRGPAKRIVLAFASARPYDGGTGAIYVLLRGR